MVETSYEISFHAMSLLFTQFYNLIRMARLPFRWPFFLFDFAQAVVGVVERSLRLCSGSDPVVERSRNPVVERSRNPVVERSRNPVVERSRNHCIPVPLPFLSCSPPVLLLCLSLSSPYPLPILSL